MVNRWGNSGNSKRLYFGGSKITADGDCNQEIKRRILHGRKAVTNLDSVLKSRDGILPTKVHLVKAMVFPLVTYGCESWTTKKAEHWRIDAFELWCWRRLLKVPWTARRSNQSILKEISPECSLKGLIWSWNSNTLATWCEELIHLKRPWCWERLRAGEEGDNRGWDGSMASPTQWTWVWVDSRSWWWTGRPGMLQSMGLQRVRYNWATELKWNILSLIQSVQEGILILILIEITHINLLVSLYSDIEYKSSPTALGVAQKRASAPGLIYQYSVVSGLKSILWICKSETVILIKGISDFPIGLLLKILRAIFKLILQFL